MVSRSKFLRKWKSALTDLGIITLYEGFDWADELVAKLLPGLGEIPEESVEAYQNGNRLVTTVDGARITFKLLNGRLEGKYQRAMRSSKNRIITALAQRIEDVEGERNKMLWIKNLPMQKAVNLLKAFDAQDGGVQTTIDVICPNCGMVQGVQLPFDRPEFWLPLENPDIL